jgi:D-threo-aldose 1-dehydrogenase
MNPFATRTIGRTGLAVTAFGLGGAPLGNLFAPIAEPEAQALINAAWDEGIRYFDTAPHYGQGLSEVRFGEALKAKLRDDFVLSTKVGRIMTPDPEAPATLNNFIAAMKARPRFDYSRDGALRSLEDSYQRLGLARVDIVFIHDIDRWTHKDAQPARFKEAMEGAYPALAELRAAGVVKAIGLGVNETQVCCDAIRHGDFDCILLAGRYTLLDQSALTEFLPLCTTRGVNVVIGGPYNSGVLAPKAPAAATTYDYKPVPPEVLQRVARLEKVAQAHRIPLAAAALQFAFGHPAVVSVIPGARSVDEVRSNLHLAKTSIPPTFWRDLKTEGLLPADTPVPIP